MLAVNSAPSSTSHQQPGASPEQVEALYEATPEHWAIMVLFAAWCQLRRGECLGLQRRDIEWHDDGTATLHVRRQLNANTGDYRVLNAKPSTRPRIAPAVSNSSLAKRPKIQRARP